MTTDVEICRWDLMAEAERASLVPDIDRIFFSSSATQSFADDTARAAFRERWLGRYLRRFPHHALLARAADGRAVGYVVGSLADPARDPLFADLAFLSAFATLTARYPAQLHINVDADWRARGVGQRLIAAFADMARAAGAPGVHAITGRGMRNVGFYLANGFAERGAAVVEGRELLFLGRDL